MKFINTKKYWLLIVLTYCFLLCEAQKKAVVSQYKKAFATYPYFDPNPIPTFSKIYPYYRFDGFSTEPQMKEWKVIELENDYIKVMILPEIGGKIWTAIEKSSGHPFIYYNHSVKFRDVAMRGPWTSGGIEANYGIMGHTPNCATPVDYTTKENKDGSVSCIIGALDLLTRTNWRIDINLPRDKAYFTTSSIWYNPTPIEQPYYHWMNAAIKASGNLEFIYPGTHYIGHNGEFADWPINEKNGRNISFYEQNNFGGSKSYHVFGKYSDFFGAYWHDDQYGMVRYSPYEDKIGKKIWIWGLSRQGMIWEKLLTDTDGQYVEVQSGRLFNQNAEKSSYTPFKHRSFSPHSTERWTEFWYPVLQTGGMVKANEWGALNINEQDGWIKWSFSPVQDIKDTLLILRNNEVVYSKQLHLKPLETFKDSLKSNGNQLPLLVTLGGHKLTWTSDSSADVLSRPISTTSSFDWASAYGLFLQGKELMDQRMLVQAEEKFDSSLKLDSNYLPCLVKMAELMYRNARYDAAKNLTLRALKIDTHDGAANYYFGLSCAQLQDIADAKDGFGLAVLSLQYRSPAYTELSKLYLKEKQFEKAISCAEKALDYNRYNTEACQLLAVSYRYLKNKKEAVNVQNRLRSIDALNAFAKIENYLWDPSSDEEINNLFQNELPQESYMELASFYTNNGLFDEGETVLKAAPESTLIYYWLAWVEFKNRKVYKGTLEKGDKLSPLLVLPFRSEMIEVLKWAAANSESWKPDYYLALLYKDKNQLTESKAIFNQLKNKPDFPPFYAARALLLKEDKEQFARDLLRAINMDKEQWRYYKLLGSYYIEQQKFDKALSLIEPFYKSHSKQYIMGMLYAKSLLLNKRYKECDDLLKNINIIPFEGATEGRELYREAKIMLSLEQIKIKNYSKALQIIEASKEWPENLGVGKPYEEEIDTRLEDWISYTCYLQLRDGAKAEFFLRKIISNSVNIKNRLYHFPASDLVTAWAIEKTKGETEASAWLDTRAADHPDKSVIIWCKNLYQDKKSVSTDLGDASSRMLVALSKLNSSIL